MEYLKRIITVLLFISIWILIPTAFALYHDNNSWNLAVLFTWIPAVVITSYIMDA